MSTNSTSTTDVMVLGAGIVGVCTALHLQASGRTVVLVDRHGSTGRETSYGNAGLIERASISPYMFPRDWRTITRAAMNRSIDVRYHLDGLLQNLPWIARYFLASSPSGTAKSARAALPLIERCAEEHLALMEQAGTAHLAKHTGWIKLYRTQKQLDHAVAEMAILAAHGLDNEVLDRIRLSELEPHIDGSIGGVHYRDPLSISNPLGLSQAYEALFVRRGGRMLQGDALTLEQSPQGWQVIGAVGNIHAREAVLTLGPWANHVLRPLGYRLPLGIKRGYHMHYGASGNAVLNHPVLDAERGYLLAPMEQGIRLTTGAEFARFDARPTPVQLEQAEPIARALFPLAERRDPAAWMGRRPCLPDMLPIIGRAPRHKGLWLNFGHQHHGLTLAAVTGRLLAQILTGEEPLTDPAPYRAERFA